MPDLPSTRLALFPHSTHIQNDSLCFAGHDLAALADQYGTPFYIYDCATLDAAVTEYASALRSYYPAPSRITYAGKAFLCKALAEWTQTHDLLVDCTGEGEIAMAVAGGVPRENILVHGVNKSVSDLRAALKHAGTIVVDNLTEIRNVVTTSVVATKVATTQPRSWAIMDAGPALAVPLPGVVEGRPAGAIHAAE